MKLIDLVERECARLEQAGVSFGHGTTNAWDETVWLVLWRLGMPLDELEGVQNLQLQPAQVQAVETLFNQRITERVPAAYLTGEAWLQGVPFHIDARSIVPRSLIAELIAECRLDNWLPRGGSLRILDMCTGNGSLAVLAAMAWPQATVLATDCSAEALALAEANVRRHLLQDRITLVEGDGLAAVNGKFDLILCNPPYVNAQSMQALPAEYRAEPSLALAGGEDGMDFIRQLLAGVRLHLRDAGALVLEIGHEMPHFEAAFPELTVLGLSTSAGDEQVLLLQHDSWPERRP